MCAAAQAQFSPIAQDRSAITWAVSWYSVGAVAIMLALGLVSYIWGWHSDHRASGRSAVFLLPGDIKYESPGGGFVFCVYFSITTSIVISVILSLVLYVLK